MKAVNVDEVLKILYRYAEFIFVTDYPKYREMQDKIANLPEVTDNADAVLDKIKTEINQLTSRYTVSRERGGMGQVEWSDRLIKEADILNIIDKYKAELVETKQGLAYADQETMMSAT